MVSILMSTSGAARMRTVALVVALAAGLGACAHLVPDAPAPTRMAAAPTPTIGRPDRLDRPDVAVAPRPNAAAAGRYKVGAPYQAGGLWYVPAEQPNYDETGLASWYGDAFDGKPTANGEIFDMRAVSAAHATLPMPCLVEVTNLENGRTLTVRLNDRGPYHPGRIIDLSRAGAQQLGFFQKGTAKVRVRYVGPAPLDAAATPPTFTVASRVQPFLDAEASPTAAAPTDRPASAVGAGYVVQAGAFSTRAAAEQVAGRLTSAGVARIRPVDRAGVTLYRVVLGPWTDAETAAQARSRVAALGFGDARLSAGS